MLELPFPGVAMEQEIELSRFGVLGKIAEIMGKLGKTT
jgi:hypothetical protein